MVVECNFNLLTHVSVFHCLFRPNRNIGCFCRQVIIAASLLILSKGIVSCHTCLSALWEVPDLAQFYSSPYPSQHGARDKLGYKLGSTFVGMTTVVFARLLLCCHNAPLVRVWGNFVLTNNCCHHQYLVNNSKFIILPPNICLLGLLPSNFKSLSFPLD